jgi:hypothetical protein
MASYASPLIALVFAPFWRSEFNSGLNSIKESRFLVACCVSALVNVRVVTVNRQRNHGGNGGEHEDDGQCCDEGLHGWSPLVFDEVAFEQHQPRRPRRNPA